MLQCSTAPCGTRRTCLTLTVAGKKPSSARSSAEETTMAWTTPTLVEICIGLEINGYLPAEI
jgi:coenzyme PQQ precursor peptide PqqA